MLLNSRKLQFGSLTCQVIDALPKGVSPECLVVLNHGFGAPGDDLADLGPTLIGASTAIAAACRFVFPAAPLDLGPMGMPGGRAWWPINMARLAEIQESQNFDELTRLEPPGMSRAGELLTEAVQGMLLESGLTDSRLVLGGFSQGAMVSTQATLSGPLVPALLALFSGTLLWKDQWTRLAATHPGTCVLQSHGKQDPVLPFVAASQLRDLLSQAEFDVEFLAFNGAHTIPMSVLQRLQERIEGCL